ncbi:TetR family transcriptional regulator [Halomonas campisalis]|uniref:TetR family transcriptional regulator n=1 Tax=Billgrantia campisalis TaxID=74661 RepID=A0ABS9P891_9GAMM|nr:TetR/AcrR family transcriptional regulator [Halomonas campisalis]MCG6657969.1 TetR family transcriptional regulator [Halomonas campisalis]MDR5863506.1 TetR family transcriptional regulator C-terminal domain-containing protein [Halomonas campisalis]
MAMTTRERLLDAGLEMLLQHGYNDLGIQALLRATGTPKGSFYHHFQSKEDFALQVIDRYMEEVHRGLELSLEDPGLTPLARARRFFELSREKYRRDGYLGCMLGGLGQELSGVNPTFAAKIEACFSEISCRIASCLEEARRQGEIPQQADPRELANLLLNCWEGAALRSRLLRDPAPLDQMLDFYFSAATRSVG